MTKHVTLKSLFRFEAARSHGIDDYEPGQTPFVTSTALNNGVVGFVTPLVGDKVFDGPALSISGLGAATVQVHRFLPKGNGGDSLTICTPRSAMSIADLLAVSAAFNVLHSWRFSFGRKCSVKRLEPLEIPTQLPDVKQIWEKEATRVRDIAQAVASLVP